MNVPHFNLIKEEDKVVLWRKITCALRKVYTTYNVNKESCKNNETYSITKDSYNRLSSKFTLSKYTLCLLDIISANTTSKTIKSPSKITVDLG